LIGIVLEGAQGPALAQDTIKDEALVRLAGLTFGFALRRVGISRRVRCGSLRLIEATLDPTAAQRQREAGGEQQVLQGWAH
jgi:hypothetical protein